MWKWNSGDRSRRNGRDRRMMSVELAGDAEAEVPVVGVSRTSCQLSDGRAEAVGDDELEHMSARSLLEGDTNLR